MIDNDRREYENDGDWENKHGYRFSVTQYSFLHAAAEILSKYLTSREINHYIISSGVTKDFDSRLKELPEQSTTKEKEMYLSSTLYSISIRENGDKRIVKLLSLIVGEQYNGWDIRSEINETLE